MGKALLQQSEKIYGFLLRFYPKNFRQEFGEEMQYVFSESLAEAYTENSQLGVISFWLKTSVDASKSVIKQHIENYQEGVSMKARSKDIIMQDNIFVWLAAATGLILMIPIIMMQISTEWDWKLPDFVIIGSLIFGTGSAFILAARKIRNTTHRIIIGIIFLFLMLWIWAELAVGVFTNWGS